MTELLLRSFADADLEIQRSGDGRTIHGLAVPFNVPAPIMDVEGTYYETFKRGAFAQTVNAGKFQRVKVFVKHDRGPAPVGVAASLSEDAAGLLASLYIARTQTGDEILELVRAGALDQLSVGAGRVMSVWDDLGNVSGIRPHPVERGNVSRTEVRLSEISVVDFAAYDLANITAVRSTSNGTPGGAVDEAAAPSTEADPVTSWDHLQAQRALTRRLARFQKDNDQ